MKNAGLQSRYLVKKLSNPTKVVDGIVLEFDDPIAREGIRAWAQAMKVAGYQQAGNEALDKLAQVETK